MMGAEIAHEQGCTQTLWLDAVELKYIEEVGTMNIFVQFNDEVVTPKLTGGILPGITRKSSIQILNDWGYNVSERLVSLQELLDRYEKGEVLEVFGTGTAAIISSVSELKFKDQRLYFCDGEVGKLAERLFKELTGIQKGFLEDRYGWTTKVEATVAV
jgi:branched-chain amino acid aminotransferase